jgi:diguanylate cyclase
VVAAGCRFGQGALFGWGVPAEHLEAMLEAATSRGARPAPAPVPPVSSPVPPASPPPWRLPRLPAPRSAEPESAQVERGV